MIEVVPYYLRLRMRANNSTNSSGSGSVTRRAFAAVLGAGYLMHPMLAIVGVAAVLLGCVGWFRVLQRSITPLGSGIAPRGHS